MIRVVIADDHQLVRQGVRALLNHAPGVNVIGEAADGEEAVKAVEQLRPDVLVVDISMPKMNGIQAAQHVHESAMPTKTVVLSMYGDPDLVRRAFDAGARGYVMKHSTAGELVQAVRAAAAGERYVSEALKRLEPYGRWGM